MEQHQGQTIERIIRRKGYNISRVARTFNVNRRSVYNWFNQQYLKKDLIHRLGQAINHDFSAEFPHLFTPEDFEQTVAIVQDEISMPLNSDMLIGDLWKDKYIEILEKYTILQETVAQFHLNDPEQ